MSKVIDGIEIFNETPSGLIVSGKAIGSDIPTTASRFIAGATILGVDGKSYRNSGTTASVSWQDEDSIATDEIADGAITNAKVNASAAIAISKLASIGAGKIIVGAITTGTPTAVEMSGEGTITNAGVFGLAANLDLSGGKIAKISIPSGTPVNAVAAVGTITVSGTPIADETMVIGGRTYTFKAARGGVGEITLDANNATQVLNIIAATDLDSTDVVCTDGTGDTVVVTAATKGTAGNALVLTSGATGIAVNGTGTLGATVAGVNGTVAEARVLYADASYLYYTNGANAISGNGWRRVSLGTAY
jgi:hypothetical protein